MGVEHSRVVLADEDVEEDPDRWCSYTECGKATLANCVPMGVEPAAHPGKDECLEVSFVRWSGPHLQKRLPFSFLRKIRPKRTARGSALERRDERLVVLPQMPSPVPRQWDATLSSGSYPLVERSASRERFY
jgi:hypothetical protein